MIVLSVDIGIKNLAMCILTDQGPHSWNILRWKIADLCPPPGCDTCNAPALFRKGETKLCRGCAKSHVSFVIPTPSIVKAWTKPCNYERLHKLGYITSSEMEKKNASAVRRFIAARVLDPLKRTNASSVPLAMVCQALDESVRTFIGETPCDYAAIENQIGPQAIRMKAVQAMLTQCLVTRHLVTRPENIVYMSAGEKLKRFPENKGSDYKGRKKLSIVKCREALIEAKETEKLEEFEASSKKDDLADAYLQGLAFVLSRRKG